MNNKNQKNPKYGFFIFICVTIIIGIVIFIKLLVEDLKKWIINNPWIVIAIIFFLTIVSIFTIITLVIKYLNYKEKYINLENRKRIEYSAYILQLENKIKNYEKIYPNLKNYEHKYQNDNTLNSTLGISGELTVKIELMKVFNENDFQLFNNLYLPNLEGKIRQIDHLLILNNFIFVIETKNWSLKTYGCYFKKNWIQYHGRTQKFIPSPLYQNRSHTKTILDLLKKGNININQFKFFNVVVFVQNNLQINENTNLKMNEKALNLFDLSSYIKEKIEENPEKYIPLSINHRSIISQVILNNNKPENIQIHQKQLSY